MIEKLRIENFAGINLLEFELNKINILLGPQALGKSITAKLLFYFKSFIGEIEKAIQDKKTKREIDRDLINRFIAFFPKDTWPLNSFLIIYTAGNTSMKIYRIKNKPLKIEYSEDIIDLFKKAKQYFDKESTKKISHVSLLNEFPFVFDSLAKKEINEILTFNQIFIPAGRSFFYNIQSSIFSLLSSNIPLDPFLIRFGSLYEKFKNHAIDDSSLRTKSIDEKEFERLINNILNSKYIKEKEKDFLIHKDQRKVNLSNASSGQQEVLPLLLVLKALLKIQFSGGGATLYIEEPEAHLFPNSQKLFIKLLARIFNSGKNKYQIIITTHSPYILSSFNNLMYAGSLIKHLDKIEADSVYNIIPKKEVIYPDCVSANSLDFYNEKIHLKNLINEETGLIDQNILDDVSNEISIEFGKLLDLD